MTQEIHSINAKRFTYAKKANGRESAFWVGHTPDMTGVYISRQRAGSMTAGQAREYADHLYSLANSIERQSIYLD